MRNDILPVIKAQLAIDLNCSLDDFDKEGLVFCEAKENPGRRPFPRESTHFEMLTMGGAIIVSATANLLPYLKWQLKGLNRESAFAQPFVCGCGHYFLPNNLKQSEVLPIPSGYEFKFEEGTDIHKYYGLDTLPNAIQHDKEHLRPDVLVLTATKDGKLAGMAGASADCEMLWQIGIDVLPEYRKAGLAASLTNRLALEILERKKIPYYGTAQANVASQRVAFVSGFKPAWVCVYRGRFDGVLTSPSG